MVRFSDILSVILRNIRLITIGPALFTLAILLLVKVVGRPYTAESAFVLSGGASGLGRFSGLAAQFGLAPATARSIESPELYLSLLTSRDVLRKVVLTEYVVTVPGNPSDTIRGNLLELFPSKKRSHDAAVVDAVNRLRKQVKAGSNPYSGVVFLRTTAPTSELAEQINRRLLDLVDEFNIGRRMVQASIEREFIEERMAIALQELHDAENELKKFLEENRSYAGSPQLAFEAANLRRNVELKHQVYTSLSQAYEQARVEEVRNTALISVIDPPEGSARPSIRLLMILIASLAFSLACVFLYIMGKEFIRREKEKNPEGFEEFTDLGRSALRRTIFFWERQPR